MKKRVKIPKTIYALDHLTRYIQGQPVCINIICSFHTNMTATLKIPGVDGPPIEVQNRLRQGCCMAPVLFNLFVWAVSSSGIVLLPTFLALVVLWQQTLGAVFYSVGSQQTRARSIASVNLQMTLLCWLPLMMVHSGPLTYSYML